MTDFSKKSEAMKYFDSILENLKQLKITAISTFCPMSWNHQSGYRIYSTDTNVYILFENESCLVIAYPFIDALDVEFRKITSLEKNHYKLQEKDCFNTIDDISDLYTGKVYQMENCNLEYGSITSVSFRPVTKKYSKWIDGDTAFVSPTAETYDEIKFSMSNGKSFVICPDDAEADGYTLFWSEDAIESITKK